MAKILLLDIETSPNTAHVWGIWQQNIGLSQLLESSYTMCYSAKWLEDDTMYFDSVYKSDPIDMLTGIHNLIDEADAVIHYNGSKFDMPTLNKEFLLHGLTPPSPVKHIDLLQVAKKQFRFVSNKLDYVAQALGLGKKTSHTGHDLWIQCMANNPQAWALMEEYNKQDVVLLEKVYYKFRPWIKHHLNLSIFNDDELVCPNCGGKHHQKRGYAVTTVSKFQRYQCQDCGNWFRGNKNLRSRTAERVVNVI
jgi:DNA polymerase elongation subunit (family B)/rubredoxin